LIEDIPISSITAGPTSIFISEYLGTGVKGLNSIAVTKPPVSISV